MGNIVPYRYAIETAPQTWSQSQRLTASPRHGLEVQDSQLETPMAARHHPQFERSRAGMLRLDSSKVGALSL